LNAFLLEQVAVQTSGVAVDATGYSPTPASQHDLSRCGRTMTDYYKGYYVTDLARCYILGGAQARGPGGSDAPYLTVLRRQAFPYAPRCGQADARAVLADKGFDGPQARPTDFIRPRPGQRPVRRPDRLLRADLTNMAHLDGFVGQALAD
jgi:hypothetical protein